MCLTAQRDSAVPSPKPSKDMCACIAVSGTSARMSSATSRRPERPRIRRKLQKAYDCDTYEEAKAALESLKPELRLMNQSAVTSLEEGQEETLTLHRLGMLPFLKRSFRTTNYCIEALNSMTGELTRKVRRWNTTLPRDTDGWLPHSSTSNLACDA